MTLNQLRYFCEVCKWNSISKAAERLYISQPSISTAIRKLEEELGVPLFVRNNNKLTLSCSGQILFEDSAILLEKLDELTQKLRLGPQVQHEIRIGISPEIVHWVIPRIESPLKLLRGKYPDLKISIREAVFGTNDSFWTDGQHDLLFASVYEPLPYYLSSKKIYNTEQKICMNRQHALAQKKAVALSDLEGEPMIRNFSMDGELGRKIQRLCTDSRVTLYYPYVVSQTKAVQDLIIQNRALCFSRPELTGIEGDQIVARPLAEPFYSNVSIIYYNRRPLRNEVAELINRMPVFSV